MKEEAINILIYVVLFLISQLIQKQEPNMSLCFVFVLFYILHFTTYLWYKWFFKYMLC
jgi:type IV secretory pathway VirB3-like protein